MARKDPVVKIEADTSQLDKAFQDAEDAVDNLSKTGQTAIGALDRVTGGFASQLVGAGAGIRSLIGGLNATKIAFAATGIGLFVTALGSLVAYFQSTDEGAEKLERAMAGLRAAFQVVVGVAAKLGEGIVNLFTKPRETLTEFAGLIKQYVTDQFNKILDGVGALGTALTQVFSGDFKGALESAREGMGKLGDAALSLNPATAVVKAFASEVGKVASEASAAADAAARLAGATQNLEDKQRAQIVSQAKIRKEIAANRLIADDETRSIEERIKASERSAQLDRQLLNERKANATEALRIQREQNKLAEAAGTITDEERTKAAELQAEIFEIETESLRLRKRLQSELQGLRAAAAAEEQARLDEEERKRRLAESAELTATATALNAKKNTTLQIEQETKNAQLVITQDYLAKEADAEKYAEQQRRERRQAELEDFAKRARTRLATASRFAQLTLQTTEALAEVFGKRDEKRAKRWFNISKTVSLANAVVNTAEGITAALTDKTQPTLLRIASTVAVAATGAAQIATIARQQFESPGGPPPPPGATGDLGTAAPPPQLDLSFMGQGSTTGGFRSYVLASDVSNAQQANQRIADQAALNP